MKIIKKIFKILLILFGLLFVFVLIVIGIDAYRTDYLDMEADNYSLNNSYLITNVNVIPMDRDTILMNKVVQIKEGKIHSISDRIEDHELEIVEGENKFLSPGLVDMHVHVWDKYELGLYLANGVTAVRNVWGLPMHLRMKKEINADEILAPSFYTTGPKLTGPEFIGDDNLQLFSPEEAKDKVQSYKAKGYDFIKTYYGLPEDIFNAVIEQAAVSDMDIVAHPSQKVPYTFHFNPQIKSIEHAEDIVQQPLNYTLDTLRLKEVVAAFTGADHTAFCPTLTVYHNIYRMLTVDSILSSEQLQFMNPLIKMVDSQAQLDRWEQTKSSDPSIVTAIQNQHDFHLEIVRRLHNSGVPIVCGTDAGIGITVPGFSIHQELAFYKEAGLSNYEVLKTATINAAQTHAVMNGMGTVEPGKVANLILLDQNPLSDLTTLEDPAVVFIKGRKLDRATLQELKYSAKDRKNRIASLLRYAENLIVEK